MGKADIIIGFSLLFVSGFLLIGAMGLPQSHVGISPGLFPAIALGGLMVLNLFLILRGLKQRREKTQSYSASLNLNFEKIKKIAIFVVFAWLYILLLPLLGFVYASGIFFWVIFILAGVNQWGKALILSFGSSIIMYFVFYRIFMVALPRPALPIPYPF